MPLSLIVHFHSFKCAGTSLDRLLKLNFDQDWASTEALSGDPQTHGAALREFLASRQNLRAVSSHTLAPCPDLYEKVPMFSILLVRDPIERMVSAYNFERVQNVNTVGSKVARETDFQGYVERLNQMGNRSCCNFQVERLARGVPREFGSNWERAMSALAKLSFVGVVEKFDESMERLRRALASTAADFRLQQVMENKAVKNPKENATMFIEKTYGSQFLQYLRDTNADDLRLYSHVQSFC